MNIPSEESVLPIVREYRDYYMEQQAILTEIKNFKKRYEKRLREIKQRLEALESDLLQFMRDNDHPGLRFQEVVLLQEDKLSSKNRKLREEEVQNILSRHRVDPSQPLYRDILESIQNNRVQQGNKKIRLKIYKK